MDLRKTGLFKLLTDKMSWHGERQSVLAHNVSNSDTPDFRPRDLQPFDFKKELRSANRLQVVSTDTRHLQGTIPKGGTFKDAQEKKPYETTPDGNQVDIEQQMLKVGQNAADYNTVTQIYRKQLGLLRLAIGRGGGGQ